MSNRVSMVIDAEFAPSASPRFADWQKRFATAKASAHIPSILGTDRSDFGYVTRAMVLDLRDVLQALQDDREATVSLFVDTLYIPANTTWLIDSSSVTIVARQIEAEANVSITVDPTFNPSTNLAIYAQSITGTLEIITPKGNVLGFEPPSAGGMLYEAGDDDVTAVLQPTLPSEWLRLDSDLGLLFTAQFQYATVLSGTDRPLAQAIATWLRQCALQSPALFDLGSQAAALEVALNALSSSTTFVPVLSKSVYLELAKAYTEAAKKFEEEYDQLQQNQQTIALWKRTGQLWLDQQLTESAFILEQLADAQRTWDSSRAAVRAAAMTFKTQHLVVEQTATAFRHGVNVWIEEQKLAMAGKIILGVINLVQALGSLAVMAAGAVATGGATAPAAGGSAVATVATLKETIETTIKATLKAVEDQQKENGFVKALKGLQEFIEKMSALIDSIRGLVESASDSFSGAPEEAATAIARIQQIPAVPAGLDLAGTPVWEQFRLESLAALEPALNNGIPSAREYQLQLELLVEYGKALTANHFGLLKAGQELARLKLQQRTAQSQVAHLSAYLKDLDGAETAPLQFQQLLNLRYLDIKRSLFVALQHYAWAFRYWALKPSQIKPSLDRRTRDLIADLAVAQREYASAEAGFKPQPQPFNRKVIINDPETLAEFRRTGTATIMIPLSHPTFRTDDRVRVGAISVWLEGVRISNDGSVLLTITTSGRYDDRLRDQSFTFSTEPLERDFEYRLPYGQAPEILVPGIVHEEHRFAYPMPTPFTAWTITLSEEGNSYLDLDRVSQITLEFQGSRISRSGLPSA